MILNRYILRQVLGPTLAAFLALNLLFLVVQLLKVADVAVGAGLTLGDLFSVVVLFLPGFFVLIIPISVLTGVLLGFSRMAGDGELTALAGAGISPLRQAPMPLLVGVVAGLVAGGVAGFVAPAAAERLHHAFVELGKRHVAASLTPGRFFEEIPDVVLYPRRAGAEPAAFNGFLMYDGRPGRARHMLVASGARVEPMPGRNHLRLGFTNGEVHKYDGREGLYSLATFGGADVTLDIDRLVHDRSRFIPLGDRLATFDLLAAAEDPDLEPRVRKQCRTTWHRRFAFPVAAVLFALLGTALGASGRLRGRRGTLLAATTVVALYYLLTRMGDVLAPVVAAWLPNLLVGAIGVWWLFRLGRRPT